MTGKAFKAWALTIPDAAVVQYNVGRYGHEWEPLDQKAIRAELILQPALTLDDCNNLDDVTT